MKHNEKLISYNANGLNDNRKRREVFYYLHKKKADIVYFQETHSIKRTKRSGPRPGVTKCGSHMENPMPEV